MLFIRRNSFGAYVISSRYGYSRTYIGYSKREAIQRYRREFGLRYKHLEICET